MTFKWGYLPIFNWGYPLILSNTRIIRRCRLLKKNQLPGGLFDLFHRQIECDKKALHTMVFSLLYFLYGFLLLGFCMLLLQAGPVAAAEPVFRLSNSVPIIEPELEQREVKVPKIDTEDFEVGIYAGALNVEDFGSSVVSGIRLGLHATEDFFLEGAWGQATISDDSFRQLSLPLFDDKEIGVEFYSLSLGYNVLPGEAYFGTRVLTSSGYVLFGLGNTHFESEGDSFTVVLGMGLRVLANDWLSIRFEAKGHEFETDILGKKKFSHNFETSFSLGVFF